MPSSKKSLLHQRIEGEKMIKYIKNLFVKESTIRFVPHVGAPECSVMTVIKLAKDIKPVWMEEQKLNDPKDRFVQCPGMDDLYRAGYIIPAWTDITIKANKAGISVKFFNGSMGAAYPMEPKLVKNIVEADKNVKFSPTKLAAPWSIFTKSGYSALVLPATFHFPFMRDIFIYPGIVDYDNFTTINIIFTALRECEIFIPAGTPLLQIIPYKREVITGETASKNQKDYDKHEYGFPTRVRSAYRKFFHKKKVYKLINK